MLCDTPSKAMRADSCHRNNGKQEVKRKRRGSAPQFQNCIFILPWTNIPPP